MENNLIVYGCSHSKGVGLEDNIVYPILVSSKNNLNLIKRYENSLSNEILEKLFFYDFYKVDTIGSIYNLEKCNVIFNTGDIVIFQLTHWNRYSAFNNKETIPILLSADYKHFTNYDFETGDKLNQYRDLHFYFSNVNYSIYKTLFNIANYQSVLKNIGINSIVLIWDEFNDKTFLEKIGLKNYISNIFLESEILNLQNKHDIACKNDPVLDNDLHLNKFGNEWLANQINNLIKKYE